MGTKSDSCGRKCISLSIESCKSNNRRGEGGVLKDVLYIRTGGGGEPPEEDEGGVVC